MGSGRLDGRLGVTWFEIRFRKLYQGQTGLRSTREMAEKSPQFLEGAPGAAQWVISLSSQTRYTEGRGLRSFQCTVR